MLSLLHVLPQLLDKWHSNASCGSSVRNPFQGRNRFIFIFISVRYQVWGSVRKWNDHLTFFAGFYSLWMLQDVFSRELRWQIVNLQHHLVKMQCYCYQIWSISVTFYQKQMLSLLHVLPQLWTSGTLMHLDDRRQNSISRAKSLSF